MWNNNHFMLWKLLVKLDFIVYVNNLFRFYFCVEWVIVILSYGSLTNLSGFWCTSLRFLEDSFLYYCLIRAHRITFLLKLMIGIGPQPHITSILLPTGLYFSLAITSCERGTCSFWKIPGMLPLTNHMLQRYISFESRELF